MRVIPLSSWISLQHYKPLIDLNSVYNVHAGPTTIVMFLQQSRKASACTSTACEDKSHTNVIHNIMYKSLGMRLLPKLL